MASELVVELLPEKCFVQLLPPSRLYIGIAPHGQIHTIIRLFCIQLTVKRAMLGTVIDHSVRCDV